jgi:mRNA-degrading endonuclease HigB of HigAB toxin-antitoxin module
VNVISKRNLLAKAAKHPDATVAIQDWFDAASAAEWGGMIRSMQRRFRGGVSGEGEIQEFTD